MVLGFVCYIIGDSSIVAFVGVAGVCRAVLNWLPLWDFYRIQRRSGMLP